MVQPRSWQVVTVLGVCAVLGACGREPKCVEDKDCPASKACVRKECVPRVADGGAVGLPTCLQDDFNGTMVDEEKWVTMQSASVVSQQGGNLVITLAPNQDQAYAGVRSVDPQDVTGGSVEVELVQSPSQSGFVEASLYLLGRDGGSYVVNTGATMLLFDVRPGPGVDAGNAPLSIGFDPVMHRFWRIRMDADAGAVAFETRSRDAGWVVRHQAPSHVPTDALTMQLVAGTYQGGTSAPGVARFDGARVESPGCVPP